MSLLWPATLPQEADGSSYRESPPDTRIRSPMDMGPPKVRRRNSAQIRPISVEYFLTQTQVDTLDTFFVTNTQSGSLPFDFPNPRGSGTVSARFGESPPSYGSFDGLYCIATIELEILP